MSAITDSPPRSRRLRRVVLRPLVLVLLLPAACASSNSTVPRSADTDLEFAGEMALRGNWREAIFRWERVIAQGNDDPRLHNNLAVAYERLGEFEKAEEAYERALAGGGDVRQIEENYRQFLRFYRDYKERKIVDDQASGDET